MRTIVTGGSAYTDIDLLACTVGYRALLAAEGKEALAVLRGPMNATVPQTLLKEPPDYCTDYTPKNGDSFVLVDLSDPRYVDDFVNLDKVVELFDHHYGHEEEWKRRLGSRARIEPVGACATLIWEELLVRRQEKAVSATIANLLYTSIFSNTLNFGAAVTTRRDLAAFSGLKPLTSLPASWQADYFAETSANALNDITGALAKDTKTVAWREGTLRIGQLELWESAPLLGDASLLSKAEEAAAAGGGEWLILIHSIAEKRTHFFSKEPSLQTLLSQELALSFSKEGIGTGKQLILRKELLKQAISLLTKRAEN